MTPQNTLPISKKVLSSKTLRLENILTWIKRKKFQLLPFVVLVLALPVIVIAQKVQTNTFSSADTAPKPDVVVVMVDDLGSIDERILDRLPNIKAVFVDQGMRFDNAYDETPLCCPGRATFLTGQHTRNHGVTYNDASLLNPKTTIAVAMHNAGYYTIMAGKYLNQPQTLADKTPDGWDRVSMLYDWRGNTSSRFWVQGTLKTAGFMDRFTQTQSLTDLQGAPSGQPLFMWVNPHAPHKAADPAKDWVSDVEAKYVNDPRCANIPPWKPANYNWSAQPNGFPLDQICQSLLTTDDAVGALRAEMAKQGRNPIWILTSDNGMAWGANGYPMKNVPQSTKSPLYFAGPGIPHTSTQALVSMIDLSPTIADLGGALMPWKDGLSFKSLLTSGDNSFRAWMIEDHPLGGNDRAGSTTGPWWGIRTPQWSYAEWAKRGNLLFDLVNDPNKLTNLASTRADVIASLKNMIDTTDPLLPTVTSTPTGTIVSPTPFLSPTPTPAVGFVESGGQVVLEAEHYIGNISRNNHTWTTFSDANTSSAQYINTLADGTQFTPPNSAEVQYPIYFSTPGTYYVWLRSYSQSGTSNAIGVGIDGVATLAPVNFPTYKSWIWGDKDANKKAVTITVSTPGLHTFSVWERKDNTKLDKIVLSTQNIAPSGLGPIESPSPTPMPTSTPTSTPSPSPTPTPIPSDTPTPGISDSPIPTSGAGASLVKWLENPYPQPAKSWIDDE